MGPRNGGNMIPDLLLMATGEDMIEATVESAMGSKYRFKNNISENKYISTHVLYSDTKGTFVEVNYQNGIEGKIIKKVIYKKKGDAVEYFDGANKAIGILFLEFNTQEEQMEFMDYPHKWIKSIVNSKLEEDSI